MTHFLLQGWLLINVHVFLFGTFYYSILLLKCLVYFYSVKWNISAKMYISECAVINKKKREGNVRSYIGDVIISKDDLNKLTLSVKISRKYLDLMDSNTKKRSDDIRSLFT